MWGMAMRPMTAVLLVCLLCAGARGQEDARRSQVAAAAADAYERLRLEVLAMPVAGDMTVQSLVDRTGGQVQLDAVLRSADQIGGTRWLDDQTCQVRLEVRGGDVARTLLALAEKNPKAVPVPLKTLRDRLKSWNDRTFPATGSSTAGNAAERLRPDESQVAWRAVNEKDRTAAISAARRNAAERVLDSLRPIDLADGKHLADALATPAGGDVVGKWLEGRPITSIEFRDDLEVRLTLAAAPDELWSTVRAGLEKQTDAPKSEAQWDQLRQQVESRVAPPVGRAVAASGQPGAAAIMIPRQPPAWADDTADAEGAAASSAGPKLRTARAAEAVALQHLRGRVNALPLTDKLTLGDAARQDPRIEGALARSLARARLSKVDYDSPTPGAVRVKMSLNLADVWRELAGR
ncbi:MAG: hypothetical protein JWN51_1741 [Phycisphaerales bacterium]|jgi:hypothetical protein|nr:hypothetical protein [Phycisphaerales bacterium]